jgi:predicted ArsR family transcriptional regulator
VDTPTRPADDVLAQPTRARLFALIADLKRPVPTEELAGLLGLHPNGVRLHLERLHAAGLIGRESARRAVGRPRDEWSIAPDARPGGDPPHGYSDLARWLAGSISTNRTRLRDIESSGRQIGRGLAPAPASAPAAALMQTTFAALGFQPRQRDEGSETVVYCLDNCPYRDAVRENQQVVCTMHRGMTRGLLDVLAPSARLVDFEPHDPDTAGCLVTVDGLERSGL